MKALGVITVLLTMLVSGCITGPSKGPTEEMLDYPTVEIIEVEGHPVYYRDLSDPCDQSTVQWKNLNQSKAAKNKTTKAFDCLNAVLEQPKPAIALSFPSEPYVLVFALRNNTVTGEENAKHLSELASMSTWPIQYQVFGAAGAAGPALEQLGRKRANAVRVELLALGVPDHKIVIMPYDPSIPGLRAVVSVKEEGA